MTRLNGDIGGRLRHARQQRGMSLYDAAGATKLSIHVLRAIERNDFESLPEGIYRKGYLRSLAGEVGLDPDQIAADFDKEFEPVTQLSAAASVVNQHRFGQLVPPSRHRFALAVLPIALAAVWFAWFDGVEPPSRAIGGTGERIQARALPTAAPTAIYQANDLTRRAPNVPRAEGPLSIEIVATGWCWVAAQSDGERVLYRLVEPGEHVVLEGRRSIAMRLGNAGSVTLSINGGPRRSAGGDGEVVELTLTPDNVEALREGPVETVSGD